MIFLKKMALLSNFIFLFSCNYNIDKTNPQNLTQSAQEQLSPDFSSVKEKIFTPYCITCHQQYENYASVSRELSTIQSAVASNRMPKTGGPLNDNLKALLDTWISQGTPENASEPIPPITSNPLEPTWKSVSENILFPKCLACHNPQGQAKFLDLSSRRAVFDNRNRLFDEAKLIDFDFPEKSYLLEILQDEEEPMPPVWSNIPRLSEDELKTVNQWIILGLP